jgi:protein-tyrosine-phosphatase
MAKHGRHDEVRSRGTGLSDYPHAPIGLQCLSSQIMLWEYGIDISGHQPQAVSINDIIWADLILAMKQEHVDYLKREFNQILGYDFNGKLYTYGDYIGYTGQEVQDPMGDYTEESYKHCANQLSIWAELLAVTLN